MPGGPVHSFELESGDPPPFWSYPLDPWGSVRQGCSTVCALRVNPSSKREEGMTRFHSRRPLHRPRLSLRGSRVVPRAARLPPVSPWRMPPSAARPRLSASPPGCPTRCAAAAGRPCGSPASAPYGEGATVTASVRLSDADMGTGMFLPRRQPTRIGKALFNRILPILVRVPRILSKVPRCFEQSSTHLKQSSTVFGAKFHTT